MDTQIGMQNKAEFTLNRFQFFGIEPDADLEKIANLKLVQLIALAPPGSQAVATLEKTGKSYLAGIKLTSHFRSFSSHAISGSAKNAVTRTIERMDDQLYRWRYGDDTRNSGSGSDPTAMSNLPLANSR